MRNSGGAFLPFEHAALETTSPAADNAITAEFLQPSLDLRFRPEVQLAVTVEPRRGDVIHTLGLLQVTSSVPVFILAYAERHLN